MKPLKRIHTNQLSECFNKRRIVSHRMCRCYCISSCWVDGWHFSCKNDPLDYFSDHVDEFVNRFRSRSIKHTNELDFNPLLR